MFESIRTSYRATLFGLWGYKDFTKPGFVAASKSFDTTSLDVDVKGRTFVVTGANSGLGKLTASDLAARGASVVMVCRNEAAGTLVKDAIIASTRNQNVTLLNCDMSDPLQIKALAEKMRESKLSIDVLINNAGALYVERATTPGGLDSNFATNTLGTYYLTELLIPILLESKDPRVVSVLSLC